MPTPTYTSLANYTLPSDQATVTFSSISSAYTDLILVAKFKVSANVYPRMRFNSDATANAYKVTAFGGNGTSSTGGSQTDNSFPMGYNFTSTSSNYSTYIIQFMSYSTASMFRTVMLRGNNPGTGVEVIGGTWHNSTAINSVSFALNSGTYSAGSIFQLYGIKEA